MIARIRTEFALCAAPLDAILVEIACKESRHHEAVLAAETVGRRYEAAARTVESEDLTLVRRHEAETWASLSTVSPLADERSCHEAAARATPSAQLALAVRPRARPRRCTGRRNIPRAPRCFVEVAPTHPELLLGGLTNADFNHVGASDLTLSLGGVVTYARLDDTTYSLPPSLYIR